MKYIIMLLLILPVTAYAVDGDDFNFDTGRAADMLTHENARNPNRYNTSEMKDSLNSWLSNPSNLKAVSGEKDNTLQTLGGEDVDLDIKCTVGQKKLAELRIDGNKPVVVNLNISNSPSNILK